MESIGWTEAALVVALSGAGLLLVAGLHHAREHELLRASLVTARLLPSRLACPIAAGLTILEIGLGAIVLVMTLLGLSAAHLLLLAALYAAFAVYATALWQLRPGVPCACLGEGSSAGPLTVFRAVVIAAASSYAGSRLTSYLTEGLEDYSPAARVAMIAAGLLGTAMWWVLSGVSADRATLRPSQR